MALWFDGVDITVEVAFTTAPLAASPAWTDITAFVRSVDTEAGRSSEYSDNSPRRLSIVVDNNDRRFDPEHGASPYSPNVLPMKRIRVQATYDSVTYPLFDGFVQGWPQVVRGMVDETVEIVAVDGSRFLESGTLADSAYAGAVMTDGPTNYWPLQEENTSAASAYVDVAGDADLRVIARSFAPLMSEAQGSFAARLPIAAPNFPQLLLREFRLFGELLGPIADQLIATVDAATPPVPFGLDFWYWADRFDGGRCELLVSVDTNSTPNRNYLQVSTPVVGDPILWVVMSNSAGQFVSDTGVSAPLGIHHVAVWFDGDDIVMYLDAAEVYRETITFAQNTSALSAPIPYATVRANPQTVNNFARIAHVAVYPDGVEPDWQAHYLAGVTAFGHPYGERSGERIGRVLDEIGWPAGLRDLSPGDTVHGRYLPARRSAIDVTREASAGDDGLLFFAADGRLTFRSRSWQWAQDSAGTFSDDGDSLFYADIVVDANTVDAIRNQVAVSFRATEGYVRVTDATSVNDFGPSLDSVTAGSVDAAETARGLANYRLRTRKDPRTLISQIEVKPRRAPTTMFPVVLGLEIGDVVTVERTPAGVGSQVVKVLAVQGLRHSVGADGQWVTRMYLAPAPADGPYLLVSGTSSQGLIGAASGNLIPF